MILGRLDRGLVDDPLGCDAAIEHGSRFSTIDDVLTDRSMNYLWLTVANSYRIDSCFHFSPLDPVLLSIVHSLVVMEMCAIFDLIG